MKANLAKGELLTVEGKKDGGERLGVLGFAKFVDYVDVPG